MFLVFGPRVLTPPWTTVVNAWNMLKMPEYWPDIGESVRAFLIALLIAFGLGITGGILIGTWRACSEVLEPLLVNINTVPKVALYPVILLIFGLGIWAKVVFGALHGVIPIMISSIGAVRNVNPIYVRCGRAMHLTRWQMLRRIWVPACVPEIFTGLRLGFSLTLLGHNFRRIFCFPERRWFSPDECDRLAQYSHDHVAHFDAGYFRRARPIPRFWPSTEGCTAARRERRGDYSAGTLLAVLKDER